MAKPNPELESYLKSQQNSLAFILELTASLDRLPRAAYLHPNLFKIKILPHQKISASQAWQIITTYLENHNLPYYLRPHLAKLTPENIFVIFHHLQLSEYRLNQAQDPELLHQLINQQNQLNQQLHSTPENQAFQAALEFWKSQIKAYNRQVEALASQLDPRQLPIGGNVFFSNPKQADQLAHHLTKILPQAITLARQLDPNHQLTPASLHLALSRLSSRSTIASRTLDTLLHDPDNRHFLFDRIKSLEPKLAKLGQTETNLALTPPPHLPLTEIKHQTYLRLISQTNLSSQTAAQLAQAITTQIQLAAISPTQPSTKNVLRHLFEQHQLDPDQLEPILSPILPHLELYRQEKTRHYHLVKSHQATNPLNSWIFRQIIQATGLDPQVVIADRFDEIKAFLHQPTNTSPEELLKTLQDRLNQTQDPEDLRRLLDFSDFIQQKLHLSHQLESRLIKWSTKLLLKSYKNNLIILTSLNRYARAYQAGLDLYLKTENILSGRFLFVKIYDWLEDVKRGWAGWIIAPVEKFSFWWNKTVTTLVANSLKALENKTSFLAKFTHKGLELFQKGGYTISGLILEANKATIVWAYHQGLNLLQKASKPAAELVGQTITWISGKLISITGSAAFETASAAFGAVFAVGTQAFLLVWHIIEDTYQFFRDILKALNNPSLIGTLRGLMGAFRRLGTKLGLGLTGAVIGALLAAAATSLTGPGAILVAILGGLAGFLLGHELGRLLNWIYEEFLKPFSLFFTSMALVFITSLGAITLSGLALLFLPAILAIFGLAYLYQTFNMSIRIPQGAGEIQSQYIQVTKHATATWKDKSMPGQIDNSQLPQTVEYSITIRARNDDLTSIDIKDEAILYQEKNKKTTKTTIYEKNIHLDKLDLGDAYTYTYTIPLTTDYRNSLLSNSVTVTANVKGVTEPQTTGTGVSISIGKPPLLPLAEFATKLANLISENCSSGGRVTTASLEACKSSILSLPHGKQVFTALYNSAYSFDVLQCVGFVRAVVRGALGMELSSPGQDANRDSYAGLYINNPPSGFTRVTTPMQGDILVMPGNPGHIAIVVEVSGNIIHLADANVRGPGLTQSYSRGYAIEPGFAFFRPNH